MQQIKEDSKSILSQQKFDWPSCFFFSCNYFSSCRFLVPSRKNVRSGFFLLFFFTRVCARARAWLVTENAWEFSTSPTAPIRERERKIGLLFSDISRRGKRIVVAFDHHRLDLCAARFRAYAIIKYPRSKLSRSDITIYESLRAKARWNYRDVPW